MARKKKRNNHWLVDARYELYGLGIIILSIVALSETWGAVGRSLRYLLRFTAGNWDFLIPPAFIGLGLYIMVKRQWPELRSIKMFGGLLFFLTILIFSHVGLYSQLSNEGELNVNILEQTFQLILEESRGPKQQIGGGLVGAFFFMILYYLFGYYGTLLTTSFLLLVAVMFLTGITLERAYSTIKNWVSLIGGSIALNIRGMFTSIVQWFRHKREIGNNKENEDVEEEEESQDSIVIENPEPLPFQPAISPTPVIHDFARRVEPQEDEKRDITNTEQAGMTVNNRPTAFSGYSEYKLPSYSLLDKPRKTGARDHKDIASTVHKLEQTLKSFGVSARVLDVHRGPAVTRYEIQPDVGVKVSRIVSLTDDLALALAAKDIRIEAPIPGKAAVGIEVPNPEVSLVTLREVLESSDFHESPSKLSIALGRDISGEPIITDLSRMPHLLVAGATGSGKSVCINAIIASILYKAKPNEVKFMMIDPKMVELSIYNGIPHLLTPVVTDPRKASLALRKVVAEMEKRYELFSQAGAKDIERYNRIIAASGDGDGKSQPLPYIVVIVDELADLMMVSSADVEDSITRLAQKARAAGIHLILATQRPSVDVITGVIKANIPSRIAFGVSSQVDSRTILDMAGAEKLLGKGDMLYLPVGSSKVIRIQGCFVSDREIEAVVHAIKSQQQAKYVEEMIPDEIQDGEVELKDDDLYETAVQLVIESQTASVSLLQRRLRIGYARAARLIDMMEQNGIVGPYEGSRPREVLVLKQDRSEIS